jgi:DNA polymerase-3 subunit delta|tara:strand:+ start:21405 stop:22448 length:1044 start_codon:yes stop_codon:yes gene_type:complete
MPLKAEQLEQALERSIAPIYLISGDEPLISLECCDLIRGKALAAGYADRQVFDAESLNWDQVVSETQAMSLFSDKRVLEIRIKSGKVGTEGSKVLKQICENPPEDMLILVDCGKLDRNQLRSKWVKSMDSAGVHVHIWPIKPKELPYWISARLSQAGIKANRQAIAVLAERVEGNLLAAKQEIEKLKLLLDGDEVDAQAMSAAVADSARYDVFTLLDRILSGDADEVTRTLKGLREEGNDTLSILWAMCREIRILIQVSDGLAAGQSMDTACQKAGVWKNRQQLVRSALQRLKPGRLNLLLRQARLVDQLSKGAKKGDAWLEMENMVLTFCGRPVRNNEVQKTGLIS